MYASSLTEDSIHNYMHNKEHTCTDVDLILSAQNCTICWYWFVWLAERRYHARLHGTHETGSCANQEGIYSTISMCAHYLYTVKGLCTNGSADVDISQYVETKLPSNITGNCGVQLDTTYMLKHTLCWYRAKDGLKNLQIYWRTFVNITQFSIPN